MPRAPGGRRKPVRRPGLGNEHHEGADDQEDLAVAGTARTGLDAQVNFFPWAHFELVLLGQYQFSGTGATTDGPTASLFMLQLHYYL